MSGSEPLEPRADGRRFRWTLVSVLLVQAIALLLLGWMQLHFSR